MGSRFQEVIFVLGVLPVAFCGFVLVFSVLVTLMVSGFVLASVFVSMFLIGCVTPLSVGPRGSAVDFSCVGERQRT